MLNCSNVKIEDLKQPEKKDVSFFSDKFDGTLVVAGNRSGRTSIGPVRRNNTNERQSKVTKFQEKSKK